MTGKARPRRPDEGLAASSIASLSTDDIKSAFRAVNNLLNDHGRILPDSLDGSLREFRSQLTERLSPYSTAQLDAQVKSLNDQFPDYEHWYIRCGTTVTWCDRRKPIADA